MWSGSISTPRTKRWFSAFDEKSQIQALDRTQPGLPMKKGRAGTMTHVLRPIMRRLAQRGIKSAARDSRLMVD